MNRTIVIGGGAIGLSVAYHLSQRGVKNVLLLERNQLSSGTSWHAAGIVGPLRATPNMTKLAMYATELFPRLASESGHATGYQKTGGYWLARKPERMDELHRIASLGTHFGLNVAIQSADQAQHELPFLNLCNHSGSMSVAEDANVNPVDLCMAYARAATAAGVEIREQTTVLQLLTDNNSITGVELSDGTVIDATHVALCCGAWSRPLAEQAGLHLPLQAVEHMYVVTEPIADTPSPFPVIRDLDTGIYIKGDVANKVVLGGFEADAKCWDAFGPNGNQAFLELAEDWEQFAPFMESALNLFPALESAGIQHFMNGPESFTMDTKPLIGLAPDTNGLYVAAGMNSVGVMSSAGIGRMLADWMIDNEPPMDLWEVDVARVDPKTAAVAHICERMKEAVSDQFDLHWPFKQPRAGRGLRKSALHENWQSQGAEFGLTTGWERGLWYALNNTERKLPYSIAAQPWQAIAEREARCMQHGTALLDLSPFSKFDIKGPDAFIYLQALTCSNMEIDIGALIYTLILNTKGGIEADVTISRYAKDHYRLTSGAATRWRDKAALTRASTHYAATITDVTEDECVIGVMGEGSRSLLGNCAGQDLAAFRFSTCQSLTISSHDVMASRVSFVGELGWELNIPTVNASDVFDALIKTGAKPMGHYALDSCRIEKGFKHWGHDLGPEISPLQAGLGFTIDWNKEFTGKAALEIQKQQGIHSRLCLFKIEGQPLMLHDEPIREAGKVVGLTTSGTQGVRTGLTLAFGLLDIEQNESLHTTATRQFEIDVAGNCYPATVLVKPPFDPTGSRMRS